MKQLYDILPQNLILENEPMKNHTTFRIGGKADCLVIPDNIEQLQQVISLAKSKNIPLTTMGNGSDLLVSDKGIRGIVIKTTGLCDISSEGNVITAQAGALLSRTASYALSQELTGMEFAHGIPGTVGGAVFMNAGAYGGEMKDIITKTQYLDSDGQIKTCMQHDFGYRKSVYSQHPERVVLSACFELKKGCKQDIETKMTEFAQARRSKQPIEMPSAGSVFKRPQGYFAGKLIEDCGLRGFSIGGAQVSQKHCGFIVNTGNASASDVLRLIGHIQNEVYNKFSVKLETEIKYIGG